MIPSPNEILGIFLWAKEIVMGKKIFLIPAGMSKQPLNQIKYSLGVRFLSVQLNLTTIFSLIFFNVLPSKIPR